MSKQKKRCEVHYTKSGAKSQVAWAEAHPDICEKAFDKIRHNIEAGGFRCDPALAKANKAVETASTK